MANVRFDKKIFEKEIGKLTHDMQEKIALFGTPVEAVHDQEIEIEIFPNRPDLLSYYGFKRSFLAFLGKKTGLKTYKINPPQENYEVKIDSSVLNVRPVTVCAIIKGLKLDDKKIKDIIEFQEKLHTTIGRRRRKLAIGIYPMDKIKLPITFKAMEPDKIKFHPLEAPREMSGIQILQRHPTGKEYAHLLAGKMKFPIFVDSEDNILSMPPIINSETTGRITEKTKEVFIECSGFDFEVLSRCLNIIVSVFSDMGGKIYQMKVGKTVTPDFTNEKMNLKLEKVNKILGLELSEKELKINLEKMGYSYKDSEVLIPSYRTDILHHIDLIEDLAIAYGYENFIPTIPKIATIGQVNPKEKIKKKIAEILVGLKALEVSNYHLTRRGDLFSKMGIIEKQEKGYIEVEGSKTEYTILRKNLTHYALRNIGDNIDSEYPQNIFELGRVFNLDNERNIVESERLSYTATPGNFTDVAQVLNYLGASIGLEFKIREQEKSDLHFIDGRSGDIYLNDIKIGTIGEIHPKILKNWKIKMPVSLFEIDLEELFSLFY